MDLPHFLAEATTLARPGFLLREHGAGDPAGFWHGFDAEGRVMSILHAGSWLTLKADGRLGPVVVEEGQGEPSGMPLFAEPYLALPPVDAVFRNGSEAVARFLADNAWNPEDSFNENFRHPTPAAYQRIWQENCPMYRGDVVASTGGWLFPWPDVEWEELIDSELILWTLKGADPWFDVYLQEGRYSAFEHAA